MVVVRHFIHTGYEVCPKLAKQKQNLKYVILFHYDKNFGR